MTDQHKKTNSLVRWLVVGSVVFIVAIFAYFIALQNEIEAEPVVESHQALNHADVLDRIRDLNKQLDALNSAMTELSRQVQALNSQHETTDSLLAEHGSKVRELQDRVSRINSSLPSLNARLDETDARLVHLEHAVDAANHQELELEKKTDQPPTVSSLMRWGGQPLAVVKTAAGYQSLATGDHFTGWQITGIDMAGKQVTLRHPASGREAIQSLDGQTRAALR